MTQLPWFRFYSEALNDRKMARAVRISGQPKAVVLGVWLVLLCLANDSPERGRLMLGEDLWLEEDEILAETGLDPVTYGKVIGAFQQLNMVAVGRGYELPNWDKRQYKSDNSSARVAAWRERKRAEESNETDTQQSVTLQQRYSNAIDTDTDTEEDKDEDVHPLADTFKQYTGFYPPSTTTTTYKDEWLKPLLAIEKAGNAEQRIEHGVMVARGQNDQGKRYTVKSPRSILTAALGWQPASANGDAWAHVEALVKAGTPPEPDDPVYGAVKRVGWGKLKQMTDYDAPKLRKQFEAVMA
jgi:hypothetical protein